MFKSGDRVRIIESERPDWGDNSDLSHEGVITSFKPEGYDYEVNFGYIIENFTHSGVKMGRGKTFRYYDRQQLEMVTLEEIEDITTDEVISLLS